MPTNAEVAQRFRDIADLLDLLGEKFKPEAYRRAARSIESLTEDLSKVVARDELRTIPGVGEAIAEKIREYLATGRLAYYDKLVAEVPPGLTEIMRLPGLGPKTAHRFWKEFGIEGPKELGDAVAAGKLEGVKGFGPKKIAQIREVLAPAPAGTSSARRPIDAAYPLALRILTALRADAAVERAEIAGSFRRCQETVGDLDVLATSEDPERVFDVFSGLPEVREVRLRGGTKETVLLTNGLQVDLRVVEPAAFGAALQYFTGSKEHNVSLRTLARDRGLKINEYGVFRGEERIAGRTEEEVYAAMGLAWIPPELRVDRGEIDAARSGLLPTLVTEADLHGELHLHLPSDASPADLERALRAARDRRYAYVGVVVAGVDGENHPFELPSGTAAALGSSGGRGLTVQRVVEVGPGELPKPVASVAADYRLMRPIGSPSKAAVPAGVRGIVHVGSGTGPFDRVRAWIDLAAAHSLSVEVGPTPERLDSNSARLALAARVPISIPTGLDEDEFGPTRPIGLGFARRAGAGATIVANAAASPGGATVGKTARAR
jgi:DNA polymerase/3'-5' exonuclease PolX